MYTIAVQCIIRRRIEDRSGHQNFTLMHNFWKDSNYMARRKNAIPVHSGLLEEPHIPHYKGSPSKNQCYRCIMEYYTRRYRCAYIAGEKGKGLLNFSFNSNSATLRSWTYVEVNGETNKFLKESLNKQKMGLLVESFENRLYDELWLKVVVSNFKNTENSDEGFDSIKLKDQKILEEDSSQNDMEVYENLICHSMEYRSKGYDV
ncbi:energy-coupling factor transporter ATP-binding protein EcfA2 [Striga asiatica]|uniref:Energy-coupling factor transporter ATP-binding protein EcfA2 n=1 Tax=Striga asiatica TaxID=4170 RepID=A0A5A7RHE9_STRAF|nr:energy-coupling factor transporter ATP-binding protein EcfA2 [Striga asiatica]